ncbi:MAG TPA: hypothetical protein VES19_08005 [Candidatus Limnocylindrales bacterium]|nr:hypothetical protein [Candidatus Limnocylindrales bacterium]
MKQLHRWWWAALGLLAFALALAACRAPIDEAGARKAATDYFMTFDHEGDNAPVDVVITDIDPSTRDLKPGWEVAISGRIVMPGLPDGYNSAMILFVDGASGAVTVIAEG